MHSPLLQRVIATLFITFITSLLSGCSPVYKITYDYSPPKSQQGLQCLNRCEVTRTQCSTSCKERFQQCSLQAADEAKSLMPGLYAAYERDYDLWLLERRLWQLERDRYYVDRLRYTDHCMKSGQSKSSCHTSFYGHYGREPFFNDFEPRRPSYEKTLADITSKRCDKNCDCDKSYRLCYTSCGGEVTSKKVCIKNCD